MFSKGLGVPKNEHLAQYYAKCAKSAEQMQK
jgi:hypothetical protein